MINLEHDLLQAQKKVTDTLAEYEKVSEDIIKSNYTSQLHALLQTISSFDAAKVKECEHSFKDEVAAKYIQAIADKIKSSEQPKPAPSPAPSTERASKSVDKVESKRESRLAENKEDKKGGFMDFVRSKFTSKDKKATQMILPDQEPKCYYDPVTKTYIFEGEEPQVPKVIQKPPSAAAKKNKQEVKKPANDDSQLGQLTAPPAFKRKSTPGVNNKSKIKIKQQAEVVRELEPLTFSRVMDIINQSYKAIIQRVKNGVYDRHIELPNQNTENMQQFLSFTQRTLQVSEQISTHEHKLIQKWGNMLASQSRELKIMEKVLKQMGDSAQTYSTILAKLNTPHENRDKIIREQVVVIKQVIKQVQKQIIKQVEKQVIQEVFNQKETVNQGSQTELIQQQRDQPHQEQSAIVKALEQANKKYYNISLNLSVISATKQRLQNLMKRQQSKIQQLESNKNQMQSRIARLTQSIQNYKQKQKEDESVNLQLSKKVKILSNQLKSYQQKQKRYLTERSQEISELTNQFTIKSQKNIATISELQQKNYILQQEKSQLLQQLQQERKNKSSSTDKVASQIAKQKSKIESQLKFYQQRQKIYISSLQNLQQQSSLMQDYESALCQENQLLNSIFEKRLQLNKNPEHDDPLVYAKPSQQTPSHSIILQLSQIVNSITETHLDRLEAYNRHYAKLHKKYLQTKQVLNKIKSNSANQNMSLNRNVTRLKGLLETYKTAKDEAEERCSQLQLQCDKLKKKLLHYKEQDQFNKSYLSRLKSSKIHSQNESVLSLQEDKDQLATQIQQLQKQVAQKNEALKKNQTDLQDLLINYEKNQTRLLQTEKRYKQSQKELRKVKLQLEQQTNNNKLLELKLQNIKDKYDQNQNKQEIKIKNAESAFEKKIKLIKHDLDQANQRQNHLRIQIEQLKRENKERLASLQQSHLSMIRELNNKIQQKQDQLSQVIVFLDETNQKLQVQQEEKNLLISKNKQLIQVQKQLSTKINDIINQYLKQIAIQNESKQNLNNIISELAFNYNSLKQEQIKLQSSYNQKMKELEEALGASFEESKNLQDQISQYSSLLQQSSERFQHIKRQQQKNAQRNAHNHQYQKKIKELQQLVAQLKKQLQERTNQNKTFEQLIQKMSQDMSRMAINEQEIAKDKTDLQEKLIQKDRLIETLSNQVNKKSEQLMVKTEQLLQKDSALLQQQEQSVMRKEQLDEVKNQLLKLTAQLKDKEKQIIELTADLQQLAEEVANNGDSNEDGSKILQETNSQLNQLRKIIAVKDQQIINFAQNQYKINSELEQKAALVEQLKAVLAKQTDYKRQIEQLNEAILQMNASLEKSEAEFSLLQKNNKHQQILIKELQTKMSLKQAQISAVLEKLASAQKQATKQIDNTDEVEGQMEYLLKEIAARETQIQNLAHELKLKKLEYNDLAEKYNHLQAKVEKYKEQLKVALRQVQVLADQNRRLLNQKSIQQIQLNEKQKEKQQLIELLQNLERQVEKTNKSNFLQSENTQSQVKEQQKLIEQLTNEVSIKDRALIDKQSVIQQKQSALRQLQIELKQNQEIIRQTKRTLNQKNKIITEIQISQQEKQRIIVELEKSLKESEDKYTQLESNLAEMAQVIESQEGIIQKLKNEAQTNDKSKDTESLANELKQKNNQIVEAKKKYQQLKLTFTQKEKQYQNKIQNLQRENVGITSLKNANKRLEESLRALEDENKLLTNQKVELMKSNDYLVGINQKLIADKSPHNYKDNHKAHAPAPSKEPPAEKSQTQAQGTKQIKQTKQTKQTKKESTGLFGALSSLFLTPTESERLRK